MIPLYAPPVLRVGAGSLAAAGAEALRLGARRAFLLTTRGMPGRPAFAALVRSLEESGVAVTVWSGTPAEPESADLDAAVAAAAAAAPDLVVGLGGGSALDLAKLTAVLLVHGGPVDRYFGIGRLPGRGMPTLMLPTTAGSGSEVSQDAVLTDRAAGTKRGIKDPRLVPSCALVDATACRGCPPAVTAASGLDALCHAVEALTGRLANPVTDLYALESVRLVHAHLPAAVAGESDEARAGMALAALLAGLAFSPVGTAAVHACGYPLSGVWNLPHGLANALMLPAVTAFNEPAAAAAYGRLRPVFGDDLAGGMTGFIAGLGVPVRLRDAGVERAGLPRLAAIAAKDERHLAANPRPLSAADLERLFEQAW